MASKVAQGTDVAGLKIIAVNVSELRSNEWNPNRMDEQTFAKELRSIQTYGFIDPVTVRELEGGFQIIDGEHRWKAATQLGIASIPATNLGPIDDEKAKKLTLLYNELRGQAEPALLASLLKDLAATSSVAELADELPMTSVEIDTLIKTADDFQWKSDEELTGGVDDVARPQSADMNEKKFQLGTVRGVLPQWLSDGLLAEYNRTATAVRSKNPETVMRDWLARLAPAAAATPPARPSTPPPASGGAPKVAPAVAAKTVPETPLKRRGVRKASVQP